VRWIGQWQLVVSVVAIALFGFIWPNFIVFRPLSLGLMATCLYAIVWFLIWILLLLRYGWKQTWLVIEMPLVLFWPLSFAIVIGCMQSNSCP